MRLVILFSLFGGLFRAFREALASPVSTLVAIATGPPGSGRRKQSSVRWTKLFLEQLEGRDVPSASVLSLSGLTAVTAIDVLDNGTVQAVGYRTDPTTSLRTGEFVTISPSGQVTMQQLAGLAGFGNLDVVPIDISNGRAVGEEGGFSPNTGRGSGRAVGWDLSRPGTVYDLGSVGTRDLTDAASLNPSGLWVGASDGLSVAVYGQLFGQTVPTVLPPPDGALLARIDAVSDGGTKVVTARVADTLVAYVYRPDNTFASLANPFASEGSTVMFGWHISPDGTKVLCNAQRFNPQRETWDNVAVVFSGPNWSQWTAATLPTGSSFFGLGADVEDSGTVTIAAADGVYLWASGKPGAMPQKVDSTMLGAADAQNIPFGIAFRGGNPTVEKGGATFIAATGPNGAYLIEIGTFTPTPQGVPPVTIAAKINGVTNIDLSQFLPGTTVQIVAQVNARQTSVVNLTGKADGITVVYTGGDGVNVLKVRATGTFTLSADLGGGNDVFDGSRSTGVLTVHGGAGNDVIIGNNVKGSTLYGDDGNDLLIAHGNTTIHTGPGFDVVVTDGGYNTVYADVLWDFILASRSDTVFGKPRLLLRWWF